MDINNFSRTEVAGLLLKLGEKAHEKLNQKLDQKDVKGVSQMQDTDQAINTILENLRELIDD